jgi:uncharacterized delta-60 repeat protein
MRSPTIESGQAVKVDAGWIAGMNTVRHPWLLPEGQYQRAVNIVNRGGIAQTRPGFAMKLILPEGNLQGMTHFRVTKNSTEVDYLVCAVDGYVYAVPFPLAQPRDWRQFRLSNVKFNPLAPMVHFCDCEKTVQTLADSTIQIVPTYNVLVMQDGVSQSAFWDGEFSRHLDESAPSLETPRGTWMSFSGGRLWIARDKLVIASDLLDPLKFTERTQGEGRGDFSFRQPVTGLTSFTSDSRSEVVVVFTEERSEILRSGIRNRSQWPLTQDFQSMLFPSTGCIAGRSIVFQAGLMWWYSSGGLVSSDAVASSQLTSQVNFKDAEMAFSKQFLSEDRSGICGLSFENYLLMSMPVRQSLNAETFVLDYSPVSESTSDKIPAWSSVWTGIRPVQWTSANIQGRRRAFAASVDYAALSDGSHNHVWEAFMPEREDSFFELDDDFTLTEYQQPIFCEFETRLLGDGQDLKEFQFAQLDFMELADDVSVRVDYRGRRGAYKQIHCQKIIAPVSKESAGILLPSGDDHDFSDLRKQSRRLTTEVSNSQAGCGTCEAHERENIDKAFSLLVRWCGQAALESLRVFLSAYPEKSNGQCTPDESKACLVFEDGSSEAFDRDPKFVPSDQLYSAVSRQVWTSSQTFTETLSCDEGSVTGAIVVTATGNYRSKISQEDADARALSAATESAQNQAAYLRTQYPCFWDATKIADTRCTAALNDSVLSIAYRAGNNAILGGEFTLDRTVSQARVAARNPDGTRLLPFAVGTAFNDVVRAVALDFSNRVVVCGDFSEYNGSISAGIARLLPSGEFDPTFQTGTGLGSTRQGLCLAIQPDNQVLVGGSFTSYGGVSLSSALCRLSITGQLDGAFTPPSGYSRVFKLAVLPSGEIVAVVKVSPTGGQVVRLLSNGSSDPSFTPYSFTLPVSESIGFDVQPDGKLVLAADGIASGADIVRLNPSGTVDGTFTGLGFNADVHAVRCVDTSIYVGGSFTTYGGAAVQRMVRLNSNGSRNAAFNSGLYVLNGAVRAIEIADSGFLFIGGDFTTVITSPSPYFAKITQLGSFVSSFTAATATRSHRSAISQADADSVAQSLANQAVAALLPCP